MRIISFIAVFVVIQALGIEIRAEVMTAQDHFIKGKQLIEANCGDCMGSTKEGLEKGISHLKLAIETGYKEKAEAYKLLADGINTLAIVYYGGPGPSGDQRRELLAERNKIYGLLYELNPDDPEILRMYLNTLEKYDDQIEILRTILDRDAEDVQTRFFLGLRLWQVGKEAEGLTVLRESILQEENPIRIQLRLEWLGDALKSKGCKLEESRKWNRELSRVSDKASESSRKGEKEAFQLAREEFKIVREKVARSLNSIKCESGIK